MRSLLFLALAAVPLAAQSPLTTIYTGGNGLGGNSNVYFNLTVSVPVTVNQLDVNVLGGTGSSAIEFWTCPTTWIGNDSNAAAWTLMGSSASIVAQPQGTPTLAPLAAPFVLAPGSYGVAIVYRGTAGPSYTDGNGLNQNYSTSELAMACGASGGIFSGAVNNPRVWNGSIHYTGGSGNVATRSNYGTGCYRQRATVYESFATAAAFDLANTTMTMLFTGSGYVALTGLATYVPPSANATALPLTDDSETTVQLPTPFVHTGGITSSLVVCSNGYVSVGSGNGTTYTPAVATFLNASQTAWRCWHDFNPSGTGSGQVKFEVVNSVAYVTWDGVNNFSGGGTATFQFQFDLATGIVHLVFQSMTAAGNAYLVGYSPGGNSTDPGSTDLSTALVNTIVLSATDNEGLDHSASARPVIGTTVNLVTTNVPPSTLAVIEMFSFVQHNPGLDAGIYGMPGCRQYAGLDATVTVLPTGATTTIPVPIPNNSAFVGVQFFTQSIAIVPGVNPLGAQSSNGTALTVGSI